MRKIINKIKDLRGITIEPFEIGINDFTSTRISILSISFTQFKKKHYSSFSRALFHIGVSKDHKNRGLILNLRMTLLFFKGFQIYSWTIKEPLDRCELCDEICITKDYYHNGTPLCCEECKEWRIEEDQICILNK